MKGNVMILMKAIAVKNETLDTIHKELGVRKEALEVIATAREYYLVADFGNPELTWESVHTSILHKKCEFVTPETNHFVEIQLKN
jgi:hypothetical protein